MNVPRNSAKSALLTLADIVWAGETNAPPPLRAVRGEERGEERGDTEGGEGAGMQGGVSLGLNWCVCWGICVLCL